MSSSDSLAASQTAGAIRFVIPILKMPIILNTISSLMEDSGYANVKEEEEEGIQLEFQIVVVVLFLLQMATSGGNKTANGCGLSGNVGL